MSNEKASAEAHIEPEQSQAKAFAAMIAVAFFLVGLITILNHEMWRDELQAWLIAKESRSLLELVRNMRYDGHPPLWYLLLYGLSRLTDNPAAMQALHLAIATATAYVFARFAPFTRFQRALFCFGYYPVYEYAVISRNYALGVLLIFCFCAAYRAGETAKRYPLLALLLALLANTNAYGFMIALALALMLAHELWRMDDRRKLLRAHVYKFVLACLIFVVGLSVSALQMLPPSDSGNILGWYFNLRPSGIMFVLTVVWRGFMPVPQLAHQLWNTNVVQSEPKAALLALLILVVTSLALARRRSALLAYLLGTGAILLFTFTKFYGSARHHGHVYVLFVACLWLAARLPEEKFRRPLFERATQIFSRYWRHALSAVLAVHVLLAALFCYTDWRRPFSRSRDVAEFVREEGADGDLIIGSQDAHVSPVTAYLQRKIYYPRGDREGTFIVWDKDWRYWPQADVLAAAKRKAAERREGVLVISTSSLDGSGSARRLAEFTGSITDENYYLYVVEPETAEGGETRREP